MSDQDYESSIVSFLSKPENIRIVYQVADNFEAVRNKLLLVFWQRYKATLADGLHLEPTEWTLESSDDAALLKHRNARLNSFGPAGRNGASLARRLPADPGGIGGLRVLSASA